MKYILTQFASGRTGGGSCEFDKERHGYARVHGALSWHPPLQRSFIDYTKVCLLPPHARTNRPMASASLRAVTCATSVRAPPPPPMRALERAPVLLAIELPPLRLG
ncbi:hypothetical protein HPB50_023405 [Hyalomma asiaticum]|uniref:Uncharacterized protein n=1 Tax=Hyalomma asiaticum TaxID=266040 RepID=A0ACB7S7H2_HYAAI|nr:hypothetical protein HPB50_023405 [Hyalomma asiaticum]